MGCNDGAAEFLVGTAVGFCGVFDVGMDMISFVFGNGRWFGVFCPEN
jgi:hypothetical protein